MECGATIPCIGSMGEMVRPEAVDIGLGTEV